jgi:hypothetical protein
VGGESVVVLGTHPGDVLRRLVELAAKAVGVGLERRQRALEAEE